MQLTTPALCHGRVSVQPLDIPHRDALRAAANADPALFEALYSVPLHDPYFDDAWAKLMARAAAGQMLSCAVLLDGVCVGMTAYIDPDVANAAVEIGHTYFAPAVRGTLVNPAAKLLMLEHGFACGARRITFRVDALNMRSRAAVTKLGAHQDGILRQDRVTWTGRVRDTVIFSILADEWPSVKAGLLARL
jgi:N-acetyltransferase